MAKQEIEAPDTLVLPPAVRTVAKCHVGTALCELHSGGPVKVASSKSISVSKRREELLLTLDDGRSVLWTKRSRCPLPEAADAVLSAEQGSGPRWLAHRLLPETDSEPNGDLRNAIALGWSGQLRFQAEELNSDGSVLEAGLRPPQLGALHAIGAHWSLHTEPATVVMPTGTGKTETMLAATIAYGRGPVLVVVPSKALRRQTAKKFRTLGLLRQLGVVPDSIGNPVVGELKHRPRSEDDLAIFDCCNVVVSTMSSISQGTAAALGDKIAERVGVLIVDEAHHVAARTWTSFREHFDSKPVLQFTATPFRTDGKLVDGKVIYSYPLRRAQEDGYFMPITFHPVFEFDQRVADEAIAEEAIGALKEDLTTGYDHVLLARCRSIARAEEVLAVYQRLAEEYEPALVHSGLTRPQETIESLQKGECRIVVCVDMLGEGFDLPQLKIAAVHDPHKSLAVLMQFAGRFTRTAGADLGEATVVGNIMNDDVSDALERLYSEDADWNELLSEFSSQAVRQHAELLEFLRQSTRLDGDADKGGDSISHTLLRPKFSAGVYRCKSFEPKRFHSALGRSTEVHAVWLHEDSHTLYFVTKSEPTVRWSRSKQLRDRQWDLFVVHYDPGLGLLYVYSSDKSSMHQSLAQAIGGDDATLISGDKVFRVLSGVKRLVFQQIGVKKFGRRNLRYAKYTGADVKQAMSVSQTSGSVKSDLTGTGFERGGPVTIGCSYKGRVWSREQGTVQGFVSWCGNIGNKLIDDRIDTSSIIDNVMIPDEVTAIPEGTVLSLEWPVELLRQSDERVTLASRGMVQPLSLFELGHVAISEDRQELRFTVSSERRAADYALRLEGEGGYAVTLESGDDLQVAAGRIKSSLASYFSDYPPLVTFCDLSELDGNLYVSPEKAPDLVLPASRFESWDWSGVDIRKESIWSGGQHRASSIQGHAADHYTSGGGFDLVFDDDSSGEAADLICMKEEETHIR
ncbi:MAG: DEAD/DEAH box helicase family protein, partial [Planctomycetota bacterium]